MAQSKFVGVDGCKGGWFSVGFDHGGAYELEVHANFSQLLDHYGNAELILVDIPIGLPHDAERREVDSVARKKLKSRKGSVFTAPTRQAVEYAVENPKDYNGAKLIECNATGGDRCLTKQAFEIAPKIVEVDEEMKARPQPSVREIHPEICFWALNGKQAMKYNKKKSEGRSERLSVLKTNEPCAKEIFIEACAKHKKPRVVAEDDIVDALAAAVTAYHSQGKLRTLPEDPPLDQYCLPMEMVYYIP